MIKRWLMPNQTDGIVLLVGLVLLLGWLVWIVQTSLPMVFSEPTTVGLIVPIGFVLLAIACCLGWNNFHSKKTWFLLCCCVIAMFMPVLAVLVFGTNEESAMQKAISHPYAFMSNSRDINYFAEAQSLYSLAALGIAFAFFVVIAGGRFLIKWIYRCLRKVNIGVSRTKGLILVAVVLFVLAMINNILIANDINIFKEPPGHRWVERTVGLFMTLVVFPALTIGLSWSLVRSNRLWVVVLAALPILLTPVLISSQASYMPGELILAAGGALGVVFLVTIFSLRKAWSTPKANEFDLESQQSQTRPAMRRFSLWSVLTTSTFVLLALSPRYLDYPVMMLPGSFTGQAFTVSDRFEAAWKSASLKRKTNGAMSYLGQAYMVECTPKTDPNLLTNIDGNKSAAIHINNITTSLDTSIIRNQQKQVMLFGGELKTSQLSDLLQNAIGYFQISDVDLVGDAVVDDVDSSAHIFIDHKEPGGVGEVLSRLPKFSSPVTININSMVFKEDWPGVLAAKSKNCSILFWQLDDFEMDVMQAMDHITWNIGGGYGFRGRQINVSDQQLNLILQSDANFQFNYGLDGDDCLDLLFANADRFVSSLSPTWFSSYRNFDVKFQKQFAYGVDDAGNLTDLYLPYGENASQFRRFQDLRSLSFDPAWIMKTTPLNTETVTDLSHLAKLTKLEELYFSDCAISNSNLAFLKPLTQLKHLQIPSVARDRKGTPGFDVCQSLESIVLLGKPDKTTIVEFQKLANLKKLVVVDSMNDKIANDKFRAGIAKALPDVEIEVVPFGQFQPDPPEKFKQHVEAIKNRLLKRLEGVSEK